jgi:hypothetical protein
MPRWSRSRRSWCDSALNGMVLGIGLAVVTGWVGGFAPVKSLIGVFLLAYLWAYRINR